MTTTTTHKCPTCDGLGHFISARSTGTRSGPPVPSPEAPGAWKCGQCAGNGELDADQWAAREARIDQYENSVLTGLALHRIAASWRSMRGYQPCMSRRTWSKAVAILAELAAESDGLAALVAYRGMPNLYGTDADLVASTADRFASALGQTWDDVLARTGPEPCRHSDAQRTYTPAAIILATAAVMRIAALCPGGGVPSYGSLPMVAARHNVRLPELAGR